MRTTEGVGVQIPGSPQDLVVLESDDPIPVTVYSTAYCQTLGRPVSSTELQIEWRIGGALHVERWSPVDLVRNIVCTSVRVAAVYRDAGYTSPRSTSDTVTAWVSPGPAANPRAHRLLQLPTQVGDAQSAVVTNIIPPFCDRYSLVCADPSTNNFFNGPFCILRFMPGWGITPGSQARGMTTFGPTACRLATQDPRPIPPGCRSFQYAAAAPWAGDSDWLAVLFESRI